MNAIILYVEHDYKYLLGIIIYKYCEVIINKVYLPVRHYKYYEKEKEMAEK